ncbi:MAG TPA: hypothetical protein VIB01_05790, partial [Steroidobacteraceae bacterium]
MFIDFDPRAGLKALTILGLAFASATAVAEPVSLVEAQALAVARDAGGTAFAAEAEATRERAVAAGELPDPEARLGAVNVPADSFEFDREDMTMIEVGVMQRFPPGRSRNLARQQLGLPALPARVGRGLALDHQSRPISRFGHQRPGGFEIVEFAPQPRDGRTHIARPRRGLGVEVQGMVLELLAREVAAPAGREALHHAHLDHGHVLAVELE